jgi:hypothetical protein
MTSRFRLGRGYENLHEGAISVGMPNQDTCEIKDLL